MTAHKKHLFILTLLFSSFVNGRELEPLADFVRRNPLFISQLKDSQMLVSRCSALYLVLSIRLSDMQNKSDHNPLIAEFTKTAEIYEQARLALSKAGKYDEASSRFLQKDFAKNIATSHLTNGKKIRTYLRA